MSPEKLYSTLELSEILGITKQGVNKAEREGRIEAPAYTIGPYKGWTKEQVERIKQRHNANGK
ncbi:hypothetical protein [Lysinibacillus capsici]|uniref:hypothetical protein n=1 Tax=Lysinibacillus capsici TaxID=2115968 RepID=UPI0034E292FE